VIDPSFWRGQKVFLTGHTGFKGAWTALVLRFLGAEVTGFALPPENERGIFAVAGIAQDVSHLIGDLRDISATRSAINRTRAEIVIHMGAQSLVQRSYSQPIETYATNVMGTAHVLEAVRQSSSVQAVVVVTSDKCYENTESRQGYEEDDALGGYDPYSNSKSCAELVTDAYRRSFFGDTCKACIGSARAGNVIGGGDWAEDRLVPDAMLAFFAGKPLQVRNPDSVRPWQYVLDPILGYLLLAERLVTTGRAVAEAWNFGPSHASECSVRTIADTLVELWDGAQWQIDGGEHPHETVCLKLNCAKAESRLGWRPLLNLDEGLRLTVDWYKALQRGDDMRAVTIAQIEAVLRLATFSKAA
jgi:CDP-glucose 4,6-dehydratase